MKRVRRIYDIDHMYPLRIENTSESDRCSHEAQSCLENPSFLEGLNLFINWKVHVCYVGGDN